MKVRWPVVAMLIAAAAMPVPAAAQFFFGPPRPSPPSQQQRGFFGFPFFGPGAGPGSSPFYSRPPQRQQPAESFNAPPPRKYETPPASTVAVIGDTMADWLAYGLEEALSDTPDVGVVRYIRPTSGLVRYDPKNDQLEWSAAVKDILGPEKPSAIVVMLGLSDRLPLRDKIPPKPQATPQGQDKAQDKASDTPASSDAAKPGAAPPPSVTADEHQGPPGTYDFHTDKWAELYSKRIDDMIAALKSKGVPVLWVGLPALYGTKSTSDMSYLDELFRERAERAGITYVDIWDGFVDENGRYVTQGPDFDGQTRRLRTGDGVHFTKAGAIKLAEYVVQDLHRVMNNHLAPIALPATTEDAPKPGTAGPRPTVGPVLPLGASVSANTDGNNLLGDSGRTQPSDPDPVATRVLVHGDPIAAPSGRADDFSWPRHTSDNGGSADVETDPAATPAAKGSSAKPDAKKATDAKTTDNKNVTKPTPNPVPAAPRPAPHASLDGGARPRPPAPVDGGF